MIPYLSGTDTLRHQGLSRVVKSSLQPSSQPKATQNEPGVLPSMSQLPAPQAPGLTALINYSLSFAYCHGHLNGTGRESLHFKRACTNFLPAQIIIL